jgi:hypothetical protein
MIQNVIFDKVSYKAITNYKLGITIYHLPIIQIRKVE